MMFPCFCDECVLRKSSHIYYVVAEVRSNAQLLYRFENKNFPMVKLDSSDFAGIYAI